MATSLVPEGGGPLPAGTEGAREGRLSPSEAAAQAAVAVLEQSLLAILLCSLLLIPIFFLGCGLRCCHLLLTLMLLSPLALAPLIFHIVSLSPPLSRNKGTHITRTLRAELFSLAYLSQACGSEQRPLRPLKPKGDQESSWRLGTGRGLRGGGPESQKPSKAWVCVSVQEGPCIAGPAFPLDEVVVHLCGPFHMETSQTLMREVQVEMKCSFRGHLQASGCSCQGPQWGACAEVGLSSRPRSIAPPPQSSQVGAEGNSPGLWESRKRYGYGVPGYNSPGSPGLLPHLWFPWLLVGLGAKVAEKQTTNKITTTKTLSFSPERKPEHSTV